MNICYSAPESNVSNMCLVSTCCFCFDLEQGSHIVSLIHLLTSVVALITSIALLNPIALSAASAFLFMPALLLVVATKRKRTFLIYSWMLLNVCQMLLAVVLASILCVMVIVTKTVHTSKMVWAFVGSAAVFVGELIISQFF